MPTLGTGWERGAKAVMLILLLSPARAALELSQGNQRRQQRPYRRTGAVLGDLPAKPAPKPAPGGGLTHRRGVGTGRGSSGQPGGCPQRPREPIRRLPDPRHYGSVAFPAEAPWFTRGRCLWAGSRSGGVQTAILLLPHLVCCGR